jgi:hypothetical protein
MSTPIQSYGAAGYAAYTQQTRPTEETARPQPSESPDASSAQRTPEDAAASTQRASENGLTSQEQQMIDRQFPEKPELSMRLYGRGQNTETVNPGAVGSRLDRTA